jgi:hypothetical protein
MTNTLAYYGAELITAVIVLLHRAMASLRRLGLNLVEQVKMGTNITQTQTASFNIRQLSFFTPVACTIIIFL